MGGKGEREQFVQPFKKNGSEHLHDIIYYKIDLLGNNCTNIDHNQTIIFKIICTKNNVLILKAIRYCCILVVSTWVVLFPFFFNWQNPIVKFVISYLFIVAVTTPTHAVYC